MGSFCKIGSLFLENGFTFFAKNGFKFNEWVYFSHRYLYIEELFLKSN